MSDVLRLHQVDNSGAAALAERGVRWPMSGFSPGHATLLCERCGKRHLAAEGSVSCLPCAVANAIDIGLRACADQSRAFYRGRKAGLDDVARFIAADAQTWRAGLTRAPMTREQREDVKAQSRDADRRDGDPEDAA